MFLMADLIKNESVDCRCMRLKGNIVCFKALNDDALNDKSSANNEHKGEHCGPH